MTCKVRPGKSPPLDTIGSTFATDRVTRTMRGGQEPAIAEAIEVTTTNGTGTVDPAPSARASLRPPSRCGDTSALGELGFVPEDYFGEAVAARYDEEVGSWGDPEVIEPTVDFLAELAGGGAALELGIGTGRIALPLAARGVRVHGIELSEAMVARLRAKSGSDAVGVTIGDFATTRVHGTFALAYLIFNTIMNLTSQEAQVACFANVAAHLEPGGRFVIEVGMPQLQRLPPGQTIHPFYYDSRTRFGLDEYDIANQGLISHHYLQHDGTFTPRSIPFRYVWPAELDLMARLAGMQPLERWGGWRREPFQSDSDTLVGVWEKPTTS